MKTAVEWLVANLDIDLVDSDWYIEQAKEMEREQIIDAYDNAIMKGRQEDGEQYYNETFKF